MLKSEGHPLNAVVVYFTNRSFSVEHRDESHVSFESSSSVFPNQLEDDAFLDLADESLELDDFFDELEPVMKFSMAWPIIRASTMALLPSHFNLLSGDRDSLGLDFVSPLFGSDFSRSLSIASFANDTVALGDLIDFFRSIGWCRLANQPGSTDDFSCSVALDDDPVANCFML